MKIVHFLYVKKLFLEDGINNLLKIVLCIATMGSLVMGTSISWSGPALPLLELGPAQDGFSIDKSQASWVGSLMPLGPILLSKRLSSVSELFFSKASASSLMPSGRILL